jgi:5-methylcytosine-specific restriction endonuclease McrA
MKLRKKLNYLRVATLPISEVLPFIFTKEKRMSLQLMGHTWKSPEWIKMCHREYTVKICGRSGKINMSMSSQRYQMFAAKGIKCLYCGIAGTYFAIERGMKGNPNKFHFNLYGKDKKGREVMLTKDHIIPRSRGGRNILSNYQPLCYECNRKKSNRIENAHS